MKIGTVYNVARVPKTSSSINVGDFETLQQAEDAMCHHFNTTPKRGSFYYRISQDDIENVGGVIMRSFTVRLSNGAGSYYKKYSPAEITCIEEARA